MDSASSPIPQYQNRIEAMHSIRRFENRAQMISTLEAVSIAFVLTMTAGCGPTAEEYPLLLLEARCERTIRCAWDWYYPVWESVDQCMEQFEPYLEEALEEYAECKFNRAEASECLDLFEEAPCAQDAYSEQEWFEYWEPCDEVWEC